MTNIKPSQRVVIIGAGNVGSSIAYSILNQEIANEILIIDINETLKEAQVLDMQDAANFTNGVKLIAANYDDLLEGDIVIITCGAAQKEGQTRIELLNINAKIIRQVLSNIKQTDKAVYIIMVTNPCDILTYIAVKESGQSENMVFGSGTYLDTGRLRNAIAHELDINSSNIHAYIIGEHGDTSLPVLSSANVGGIPLNKIINVDKDFYNKIATKVRASAYKIIEGKKATYYGIGSAVSQIVRAIIRNEKVVMPLSVMLDVEYGFEDLCIGIPVRLSNKGIKKVGELELNQHEKELFIKSAEFIKETMKSIA